MVFKGGFVLPRASTPSQSDSNDDDLSHAFSPEAEFGGKKHDMEWYLEFAKKLIAAAKTDQAVKLLFEATEDFPDEVVFWHLLIRTLRHKKYRDVLAETLTRAYARFPEDFLISVRLAQNLIAADRISAALDVLLPATKLVSRGEEKGQILHLLSRADRLVAISVYREIIEREPGSKWKIRFLADLAELLFLTHQPEEGMLIVQNLLGGRYKQIRGKFLEILAHASGFDELREPILRVIDEVIDGSAGLPEGVHKFALTLERTGQRPFAIRVLERFVLARPEQVVLLKWLAELLWNAGDKEAAIEVLKRLIEANPEQQGPLKWLVELLLGKGDPRSAAQYILEAANQFNTLISAKTLKKFLSRPAGSEYAFDVLETYTKISPNDVGYAVLLAKTLAENGRNEDAELMWGEVVTLVSNRSRPALWICRLIASDRTGMSNPWLARVFAEFA